MANNILFVFEGEKTERQILNNLHNFFLNANTIITCAYCTTVYPIYKEIATDEDLDIFNLLKTIPKNTPILNGFDRDDFAEIYMFFDYDGHSTGADDSKLRELLEFFNEETDKGKLYISYPMIESLKHVSDYLTFKDSKVKCKENIYYKKLVSEGCMKGLVNFTAYTNKIWKKLIMVHLMKMNYIVRGHFILPLSLISQLEVFDAQKTGYIDVDTTVAVLNAFPMFLHDYYGSTKLQLLIV